MKKNETPEDALKRELLEELGINVNIEHLNPWKFTSYKYEKFNLLMTLFVCKSWKGIVQGNENQKIKWCNKLDIKKYLFLPADRNLIKDLDEFFK